MGINTYSNLCFSLPLYLHFVRLDLAVLLCVRHVCTENFCGLRLTEQLTWLSVNPLSPNIQTQIL